MSVRDGPFHPLRIEAVACDPLIARQHIEAFIGSFIRAGSRERAQHIVFKLAPKDPHRLKDLWKLLDERFTSPPQKFNSLPATPPIGIYITGKVEVWLLSLADAETVSGYLGQDAIWSGTCGSYAAFLDHEWHRWICYRPKR
jgi:hypothetical protein